MRNFRYVLLVLVVLFGLGGCGGSPTATPPPLVIPTPAIPKVTNLGNPQSLQRFEEQILAFARVKGVAPMVNEKATSGLCAGVNCKFWFEGFADDNTTATAGAGWFVGVRWGDDAHAEMAVYWASDATSVLESGALMVWAVSGNEMAKLLKGGLYEVVYLPPLAISYTSKSEGKECRLAWDTGGDQETKITYYFPSGPKLEVPISQTPADFSMGKCYWVCASDSLWNQTPIIETTTCCGGKTFVEKTITANADAFSTYKTNCQ